MAKIQLVIEIDEEEYKQIINNERCMPTFISHTIKNGIPLPKGHNENNDYADCDQFVCSECGIELQDWHRVERDIDDGDITYHEYTFRYCPNCGAIIEAERDCKSCKHSDNGNRAETEECHECMWESQYEQQQTGKWIVLRCGDTDIYKCSECGMRVMNPYRYCHNCGARMGVEKDDKSDN